MNYTLEQIDERSSELYDYMLLNGKIGIPHNCHELTRQAINRLVFLKSVKIHLITDFATIYRIINY